MCAPCSPVVPGSVPPLRALPTSSCHPLAQVDLEGGPHRPAREPGAQQRCVTSPLRACGLTPALPTDRAGRAAPVVAEMVFQAMKTKGHPAGFRTFCKGETMDSFLHACINYFKAFFEARAIREAEEREAEKFQK